MNHALSIKRIGTAALAILMALAALLAIFPTSARAEAADYSTVRIRLSVGSVKTMKVVVNGRYFVYENNKMINAAQIVLTANPTDGTVIISEDGGSEIYRGSSFNIIRLDDQQGKAGTLRLYTEAHGWRNYLGHMQVRYNGGYIQVINHISLEKYLYGVVAYEMNNTWPIEALKAQTIAARGYAVNKIRPAATYDLVDTSSDQVYKGYDPSYANVIAAVDSTKYQVLQYGSEIITAYYAASNGGQTDSNKNAWGSAALPYLPIKDDPYDLRNPNSLIQRVSFPKVVSGSNINARLLSYLKAKALPILQSKGYSVLSDQIAIQQIPAVELYAPKYPSPSRCYTKAKVQLIVGITTASVVQTTPSGNAPVKPNFIPMTDGSGAAVVDESGNPMYINTQTGTIVNQAFVDAANAEYEAAYAAYIASSGQTSTTTQTTGTVSMTIDFDINDLKDPNQPYQLFTNSSLRMFTGETTSTSFNIINVRYGHGVGMSQRGAQQQALEGRNYKQILDFYYTGTTLKALAITEKVAPVPKTTIDTAVSGVMNAKTTLRAKASTSGKAVTTLAKKAAVGIIEQSGAWVKVQDTNANIGYVMLKYVTLNISADKPVYATTNASKVYLLGKASSSGKKLATLSKGAMVSVQSRSGSYFKVTVDGKTGYIADKYLNLVLTAVTATPTPGATTSATAYAVGATFALDASKNYGQVVNAEALTIHQSGSLTAAQLGTIPNSYLCEVLSKTSDNRFYKIVFNGVTGYVLLDSVNIMTKGATATVLEVTPTTYKILLPNTTAFILSSMVHGTGPVAIATPAPTAGTITTTPAPSASNAVSGAVATGTITGNNINLRSEASDSSPVLMSLPQGTLVFIFSQNGDFYKVMANGAAGYVAKQYVGNQQSLTAATSATTTTARKLGSITASSLKMYSQATTSSTVIATLKKYNNVDILSETSSYYKIKTADGKVGYASKKYIALLKNPGAATTTVNIRKSASTSASVVGQLTADMVVEIIATSGDWYQISAAGVTGYVLSTYVAKIAT